MLMGFICGIIHIGSWRVSKQTMLLQFQVHIFTITFCSGATTKVHSTNNQVVSSLQPLVTSVNKRKQLKVSIKITPYIVSQWSAPPPYVNQWMLKVELINCVIDGITSPFTNYTNSLLSSITSLFMPGSVINAYSWYKRRVLIASSSLPTYTMPGFLLMHFVSVPSYIMH